MKKGQILKCVDNKNNDYLTAGKKYTIVSAAGDTSSLGYIRPDSSAFEILDDVGDFIYQNRLNGLHARFKVVL